MNTRLVAIDLPLPGQPLAVVLGGIAIIGLFGARAGAESAELVRFEQFVQTETRDTVVIEQVLVYDYDSLLGDFRDENRGGALLSVYFSAEDGLEVVDFDDSALLEPDSTYVPFAVELAFTRPRDGTDLASSAAEAFGVKMEIEVQVGEDFLLSDRHFWVRRDLAGTSLISFAEYSKLRLAAVPSIEPNPLANLEPGDVPGESTTVPGVCEGGMPCGR